MYHKLILAALCCLLYSGLQAQPSEKGEFLIVLDTPHQKAWAQAQAAAWADNFDFALIDSPDAESGIFLLRQLRTERSDDEALQFLRRQPSLRLAQRNHIATLRNTTPNDPQFAQQWQYINTGAGGGVVDMDLDADVAWDITTGGLTSLGDTIVVAVIDNGVNFSHPDLLGNLWRNHAEIPNNQIDDDGNGYVDDYRGWNVITQNDDVVSAGGGSHGTPVAAIVGAQGNNSIGVTGVNWRVKLMIIRSNFSTTEAHVIAAYAYALRQRRRYNATQGREGAFVVVTNASWGVDYGRAADAPIWCAYYDTLGAAGILSVGATANIDINVDVSGDLPTTCPSQYLLGVTNLDRRGWKVGAAGYGAQSIDFGAFGEGVYTCNNAGSYSAFGGTSAAAPHASGAIALAYAALCEDYIHLSRTQPARVAEDVRRFVLDGVRSSVYMDGITTTGGQLNLNGTLLQTVAHCPTSQCLPPYSYEILSRTRDSLRITWRSFSDAEGWALQVAAVGDTIWSLPIVQTSDTLLLTNLQSCTGYRLRLRSVCAQGALGRDSVEWLIYTDGCCTAPENARAVVYAQGDSARFDWSSILAAQSYRLQYRAQGATIWQEQDYTDTSAVVAGLAACTAYEWRIASRCDSQQLSAYSPVQWLYTPDCTDCAARTYCTQIGQDSQRDYIDNISIDGVASISTGDNGGYAFIDTLQIPLQQGGTYTLRLRQSRSDLQMVRIWLDANQDGNFLGVGEMLAEGRLLFVQDGSFTLRVPSTAAFGLTRLRVTMRYNAYPNYCESFAFGEVEDYCVFLQPAVGTAENIAEPTDEFHVAAESMGGTTALVTYTGNAPTQATWQICDALGRVWASGTEHWQAGEQKALALPDIAGVRILSLRTAAGSYWVRRL